MAESDVYLIPQTETITERLVVVTDAQKETGYQFDAVTRYRTDRRYKPTRHVLPSGSSITDHVHKDPIAFQLVGVITPYNQVINVSTFLGNIQFDNPLDLQESRELLNIEAESAIEVAQGNRDQLVQYADDFTLMTVLGNDFAHANMLITSVSDPRNPDMGDAFELTIGFRQIRIPPRSSRIAPLISEDVDFLGGGDTKDFSR